MEIPKKPETVKPIVYGRNSTGGAEKLILFLSGAVCFAFGLLLVISISAIVDGSVGANQNPGKRIERIEAKVDEIHKVLVGAKP